MKRLPRLVIAGAALGAVLWSGRADARWFDLHLGVRGGGVTGGGSGGTGNVPDFFERARGPGAGFELGAKLLIFDVSANFTQLFDGNGRAGTLTQFLAGIEFDIPLGEEKVPGGHHNRSILRPGVAGGIALGTPRPVMPPLDNAQVSDKGIISYGKIAYEYFLSNYVGVGAQVMGGYHYFLWGAVNSNEQSSGYQVAGFATMTFHLGY